MSIELEEKIENLEAIIQDQQQEIDNLQTEVDQWKDLVSQANEENETLLKTMERARDLLDV